jgi:hypothetical protein
VRVNSSGASPVNADPARESGKVSLRDSTAASAAPSAKRAFEMAMPAVIGSRAKTRVVVVRIAVEGAGAAEAAAGDGAAASRPSSRSRVASDR